MPIHDVKELPFLKHHVLLSAGVLFIHVALANAAYGRAGKVRGRHSGDARPPLASALPQMQELTNQNESSMNEAFLQNWIVDNAGTTRKPLPDIEYLQVNAKYALLAREHRIRDVGKDVPEDIFLESVLPYQNVDEPIDPWRELFFKKLEPFAENKKTLREVADTIVPYVFAHLADSGKKLEFKPDSTPAVMAPVSQTLKQGGASCTGLSILVTNALRSVGVPARVVGTPEWNLETGGNHNWVEAWLGDGWHFMDAVPTEKVEWDKTWFTSKNTALAVAGTIHGIYTPVWNAASSDGIYNLTWRTPNVKLPARDLTLFYKALSHGEWRDDWEKYRAGSEDLKSAHKAVSGV